MKAALLRDYGGKDAIETKDNIEKPVIEPGQVLVEVYAAGVNPFDVKVRDGMMKDFIPINLPAILGGDVAGKVVEIGEDVSGFEVGQEVYGSAGSASGQGSFAEFAPVKVSQLVAKPKSVDFVTAAALPLAATSAYQALVDHMELQPGQKILIHGGAGGIGSFAIQIAKNIGAHIATTASSQEADYVKLLGADEVIDYKSQDFSEIVKDYDAAFDTVGGETNAKSYLVLKPGGILVSMVEGPNEKLVAQQQVEYVHQGTKPISERLSKVAELVDQDKLKVNVDKVFPLDQAGEALEYLKTGHPRGKVVIKVK